MLLNYYNLPNLLEEGRTSDLSGLIEKYEQIGYKFISARAIGAGGRHFVLVLVQSVRWEILRMLEASPGKPENCYHPIFQFSGALIWQVGTILTKSRLFIRI